MDTFKMQDTVRINTPGESHHNRVGTIVRKVSDNRFEVELGDVQWAYRPSELERVDQS